MYFILSKTLSFLISPLVWVVGISLYGIWKNSRKHHLLSFITLLIFSNPILSNWALSQIEYEAVEKAELPIFDVGIVLTGITHLGSLPEDQIHLNDGADRITEAMRLYHNGFIQRILISGGSGSLEYPDINESPILREMLVEMGVHSDDILIENKSKNTFENAQFSKEILSHERLADRKILLITSAFHMDRAIGCFNKQGLEVVAYPVDYRSSPFVFSLNHLVPSGDALDDWRIVFKEWIGSLTYQLMGYM